MLDVGNLTSYTHTVNFTENTTYFVTVIPYNSVGNATNCTESSFTTETVAVVPNCITITNPTDTAIDVSISEMITWNTAASATGYFINIGTTSGGTELVNMLDVGNVTSYTHTADFTENTTYFITVIPYNSVGNATNCTEISFTTEEELFVDETKYVISPDGDGITEYWEIVGIENHPENTVSIYNRWGDLVFEVKGYNNSSRVFNGLANRMSKFGANELPEGTYFFNLNISGIHNFKKLKGYLILKR